MAECRECKAKERQRLLALFLPHFAPDPRNVALPVVHFAPEPAISNILQRKFRHTYTAADIDPHRYRKLGVPVMRVDMTNPEVSFMPGALAGFVHSHVLEHLPVPLSQVLPRLNDCLAPGGFHIFQLPVYLGRTDEDLAADMPPEERLRRFGHVEHMRRVGTEDVGHDLLRHFEGFERIRVVDFVTPAQIARAAVPVSALTQDTPHSLFVFVKSG